MNHPECLHPTSTLDDFSGAVCCICDDRPCTLVTVEAMRLHRLFDIELYSEVGGRVFAPPF